MAFLNFPKLRVKKTINKYILEKAKTDRELDKALMSKDINKMYQIIEWYILNERSNINLDATVKIDVNWIIEEYEIRRLIQ